MVNGRIVFYMVTFLLLCLGLAWKLECIVVWRTIHKNSVVVDERSLKIPFPWVLSRTQSPAKIRSFATLWPTWTDDYVTVLIEKTPLEQQKQSDEEWIVDRNARYSSGGYKDIRSESFDSGKILCAEVSKDGTLITYCRSKANINLIYTGSRGRLHSAIELIPG